MNLRQKAKRYKKLYEDILPKKPYPVVYVERAEKHYRVCREVSERELAYADVNPQRIRNSIENSIIRELRPYIWNNLKTEKDSYTGAIIYSLDVWM